MIFGQNLEITSIVDFHRNQLSITLHTLVKKSLSCVRSLKLERPIRSDFRGDYRPEITCYMLPSKSVDKHNCVINQSLFVFTINHFLTVEKLLMRQSIDFPIGIVQEFPYNFAIIYFFCLFVRYHQNSKRITYPPERTDDCRTLLWVL